MIVDKNGEQDFQLSPGKVKIEQRKWNKGPSKSNRNIPKFQRSRMLDEDDFHDITDPNNQSP